MRLTFKLHEGILGRDLIILNCGQLMKNASDRAPNPELCDPNIENSSLGHRGSVSTFDSQQKIYKRTHQPWLNHAQQLNYGSAMIMRKLTEMRRQMYNLAGCYFGRVSQFLGCWRFLKLPSALEPNEFLANSPVRVYIQPIISVSIRLFV
ncbi:hypothetical protein AVEN_1784-1 [Araneus ventricosus]|uniref:Uncharacterized protein n=1 Tax=Araneus ventricosus TaxID=182803 RepID=A0A4Y2RKE8_ARAVE|nr:hypothetical protein AVEN_112124-1 [Araneus ventricosus]GBN80424.1 hypothetical protein AVEN_1784-1 [Araneus ventricosus]